MFCADEQLRRGHVDPRQGIEACGMVQMMRSCENLLCILGETRWADRCEDVAFNTYPASVTADYRGMRYLMCPNLVVSNGGSKVPDFYNVGTELVMDPWGNERGAYGPDGYRCCLHNTSQSWGRYTGYLYLATPWNYGLVLRDDALKEAVEVIKRPWPRDDQPFAPDAAPVVLRTKAARIPNRKKSERDIIDPVPRSPVQTDQPVETVDLIPMGAARLRISAFPTVEPTERRAR